MNVVHRLSGAVSVAISKHVLEPKLERIHA
jgi:hypothetical protein